MLDYLVGQNHTFYQDFFRLKMISFLCARTSFSLASKSFCWISSKAPRSAAGINKTENIHKTVKAA